MPPPPEGHGDTAHAIQVAREAAELFDFPLAGRLIPGLLRGDDPDAAPARVPTNNVHIRSQSLRGIRQHKNGEEHEFDDFPVSERSRRPAALALPDVDWTGQWQQQSAQLMRIEGDQEVIDGPFYLYLQTWFIHHEAHTICRHPRPVRLTNEVISWSYDLRQTWSDLLERGRAVRFYVVQPTPMRAPLQSYAGHVLLEQAPLNGRAAVVVSTLFESLQGNALMQFAKSFPRFVTAEDVIEESELTPHCSIRPCSVWIGPRQLNIAVATELSSGQGLRVHVKPVPYDGSDQLPPPIVYDNAEGVSLLQTTSLKNECSTCQHHTDHEVRQTIHECHVRAAQDPPPPPHEEDQPLFVQQMLNAVRLWRQQQGDQTDGMFHIAVWYSNHITDRRSDVYRTVRLGGDFMSWRRRIINIWSDHVLADQPLDIAVVEPTPNDGNDQIVIHVVIIQQPLPEIYTVILSVVDLWGDPWYPRLICDILPADADVAQVTLAAGVSTQCPPFAPGAICTVWHGEQRLVDQIGAVLHHGAAFHVSVDLDRGFLAPATFPMSDIDSVDAINMLQTRVVAIQNKLNTLLLLRHDSGSVPSEPVMQNETPQVPPQQLVLAELIPHCVTFFVLHVNELNTLPTSFCL